MDNLWTDSMVSGLVIKEKVSLLMVASQNTEHNGRTEIVWYGIF